MGSYWSKQNQEINMLDLIWNDISNSINQYKIYKNVYNLFIYDQSQCFMITHEQTGDRVIFIKGNTNYLIKYIDKIEVISLPQEENFINKLVKELDNNSFGVRSGNLKVDINDYISSNCL